MNINTQLKVQAENLSILYVEDESDTRIQISEVLGLFFKKVFSAEDGVEALELFKINSVDLVMTDANMPKMNGLTLLREIKKINPSQKVILLTADDNSDTVEDGLDFKLDGFLLKPITMDKMLTILVDVTQTIETKEDD